MKSSRTCAGSAHTYGWSRFFAPAAMVLALLAVSLFLAGCSASKDSSFSVALVTDIGGIDDKSFNQGTWEGLERFATEAKLPKKNYTYLQSSADSDYIPNLSTLADEKFNLIVAAGFLFVDAISEVAKNYPETNFLLIDTVVQAPNVVSAVFSEEQGSFLVGVAAGLQAKAENKPVVGFLGGMKFDVIYRFEAGFEAGVKAAAPDVKVLVEYAGDFGAPQIGQALAAKMYDAGASSIFHAAGATGNGAIKEAKDRAAAGNPVWVIGVDRDQYEDGLYADGKSVVLTSMVKRVDIASYGVASLAMEGKFPGGQTLTFNLQNNGVGIPDNNPNLSADITAAVADYKLKVLSGEIAVPTVPSTVQ